MKKALLVIGALLGLALLVVVLGWLYLLLTFPAVGPAPKLSVEATPERLARGKYLVENVAGCIDCHSSHDWNSYAAPIISGTEGKGGEKFLGEFGALYAPNITPAAIGDWSDGELYRAITAGVNKDGKALFPLMPYLNYARMSNNDLKAVIAYVRALKPIENQPPARVLNFPLNLIVRTMPKAAAPRQAPDKSDRVAYGKYLATMASCADCHSPQVKGAPLPGMDFAGGFEISLPDGRIVRSANITPDKETRELAGIAVPRSLPRLPQR